MAIECRDGLEMSLGCSLPATLLFDYPTLTALTEYLLNEVLTLKQPEPLPDTLPDYFEEEVAEETELDAFSVGELRALLDEKLAGIEFTIED
jgi:myxalamid-type polyketide synthase MxaB